MSNSDKIIIEKRNGNKETLSLDKIKKVLEWTPEWVNKISCDKIEVDSDKK